ncbi:MAG: D-glycero-beta-D-manno-heptose 1,7-bisphosphate 7-phosphatase [Armatimonadetes bacterium]|nr:D-glycero-beta-D-manno-heptose 1,7-bisphosphate 7-phosphatase [Armatimonadota bacterium]
MKFIKLREKLNKAVFIDRDGTINKEAGYISSINKLRLLPKTALAIKLLNQADYKVVVISNQSGIARGFLTEIDLKKIHRELALRLKRRGAILDKIYYCPHHPEDNCNCRKPKVGLLKRAARELNLNLSQSFMIGDKLSDIKSGINFGIKAILVFTGYGKEEYKTAQKEKIKLDYTALNLYEAVRYILNKGK